tara:strand:+ start:8431 stop:11481 length:3051 start_codon:yes stop_codon:yes gene_type:complete
MTTPRLICGFPAFLACFLLAAHVTADEPKHNPAADKAAFEKAAAGAAWAEVFSDPCTTDWKEKWFLDGVVGTVTNSPEGMTLTAGPEFRNDAHHMVLWTKDSFEGELKIEYEYTRLDKAPNCVTILYIQATGIGKGPYAKDITKWSGLRKTPAMKMYYDHMHSYHISYAANPGTKEAYIRGRRYMPERQGLKGTALNPDYSTPKLFATGVRHHITVIKKDRDLHMRVENTDHVVYCHMTNPDLPVITEGRIGLRHMFTRSARYANLRVSRSVPGGDAGAEPNIGKLRSELRARSAESASFLSAAEPASGEAQEKAVIVGLIGGATVAVQSGWGPALAQRFDRRAQIVNYAKNGATLQVLSKKLDDLVQLKPDYVLIQMKVGVDAEQGTAGSIESARIRRVPGENADKLFEGVLNAGKVWPLQGGFAHLWLKGDLAEGNRLIREAHQAIIKNEGGTDAMTPEIAASEHVKWQMRTWNRIYQLFNDKSRFHPGRLDTETQVMIEEMFWFYVCDKSRLERAAPQHVWGIHNSENHEMMHYSNALLALQALKESPAYKGRRLPDGHSLKEHYEAWNSYYKLYCVERAKHGLLIEIFSGYGKYTVPELLNMYDLAEDPVLRSRMGKLLDLIWADWAIGQLNGVRGGGRLRLYQGDPAKPERTFRWGAGDTWLSMSRFLLNSGTWWNPRSYHPNPIIGYPWVLATTQYRLPDVIVDIANDAGGRGEYNYVARRVARQRRMAAKDVPVTRPPWYALDPEDPGMVSYDHCTPDYVMGSLMIDPTLPRVSSRDYLEGKDLAEGYPNLTAQNRYHGITFASDVNARVIPQCEGLANGKTYGEQQAVQRDNVLLAQRHNKAKQTGDMRILFGLKGMKARLVERDGWLILKEDKAWLGIKGFSRTKSNQSCGYKWDNEVFLRMADGKAPVALIAGRSADFADIEAFASYLGTFSGTPKDGWFKLSGGKDEKLTLSLHLASEALPRVNGTAIDLRPGMLFDSPFMSSEHGSGVVTIRKGGREVKIDMNE